MNSVVEDIANMILAESSMNLTLGVNLHLYREPAKPDQTVSLFETPGMPPLPLLNSNEDTKHFERPSIQIRIRAFDADKGFELAYKIMNLLHARSQEVWGDYLYIGIFAVSNPDMLDWDVNNRVRIVLNLNIHRRLIVNIPHWSVDETHLLVQEDTGDFITEE